MRDRKIFVEEVSCRVNGGAIHSATFRLEGTKTTLAVELSAEEHDEIVAALRAQRRFYIGVRSSPKEGA